MNNDDLRARLAEVLYGDGDEMSWDRAIRYADMVIWELGMEWRTVE